MKTLFLLLTIALHCLASVPLKPSMERGIGRNSWENSGKFEGDMVFSRKRNGLLNTYYRWPWGQICYTISSAFTQSQADHIRRTYQSGFLGTCLRPVECQRCCNGSYVHITNNPEDGCFAIVGRIGGEQNLNLAQHCLDTGTILHEMLHAAGFWHQQSVPERDEYVKINLQNVRAGFESNFNKYSAAVVTSFNQSYDYCSIMHYSTNAFSKNGLPTVVPIRPTSCVLGHGAGLSAIDKIKVNRMYRCRF